MSSWRLYWTAPSTTKSARVRRNALDISFLKTTSAREAGRSARQDRVGEEREARVAASSDLVPSARRRELRDRAQAHRRRSRRPPTACPGSGPPDSRRPPLRCRSSQLAAGAAGAHAPVFPPSACGRCRRRRRRGRGRYCCAASRIDLAPRRSPMQPAFRLLGRGDGHGPTEATKRQRGRRHRHSATSHVARFPFSRRLPSQRAE